MVAWLIPLFARTREAGPGERRVTPSNTIGKVIAVCLWLQLRNRHRLQWRPSKLEQIKPLGGRMRRTGGLNPGPTGPLVRQMTAPIYSDYLHQNDRITQTNPRFDRQPTADLAPLKNGGAGMWKVIFKYLRTVTKRNKTEKQMWWLCTQQAYGERCADNH